MKKFLDIYLDILYRYSTSNYLNVIPDSYLQKISPNNVFGRIWISLKWVFRDIINPFRTIFIKNNINESNPSGKIWIFISSKNHYDSIGFLRESIKDSIIVVPHVRRLDIADFIFPYYLKIFYLVKLPVLWLGLLLQQQKIASRYFNFLFESIGVYEISIQNLKKYRPQAIIFANDHIIKHRALLLASEKLGIKNFYLQHATITKEYPPLKFDYALLEGKDAYEKYKYCGRIKSEIKFVGMPKFDDFVKKRKIKNKNKIEIIGIAINPFDDFIYVYQLIEKLNNDLPGVKIFLRLHPQEKRILNSDTLEFKYSNPHSEKAFEFLNSIDLLISGDSSIHLEAALLYCPSIIFGFNSENFIADYYEYVHNGLIPKANNLEDIVNKIKQYDFKFNINKIKHYNDVIGTEWEGRSKELIVNILNKCLN